MTQLTLADRVRGWFDSEYAARASVNRYIANTPRAVLNQRRGGTDTRTDADWSAQPWGPDGSRTLSSGQRRAMVKRARSIDEDNLLGSSLLDRSADNVIGEQMSVEPLTLDRDLNRHISDMWADWSNHCDAREMDTFSDMQRAWFRSSLRDGDIGVLMLDSGKLRTVESDYIRTPSGGDIGSVVDGIELGTSDQPVRYWLATQTEAFKSNYTAINAKDFAYIHHNERQDRNNVRGVPILSRFGWILDQIDGTIEAVVMAHRMSALFGLVMKRQKPAAGFGALPLTGSNAEGESQRKLSLEPAMVEYINSDEAIEQIKPTHPTTSFSDFMRFLIRLSGLKLGLPLELALLDFSQTNYSSARASMEQSYRRFRIMQRRFANRILTPIYNWRLKKWIGEGAIANPPDDIFKHRWQGQPWPYLDPQKDAIGALVAVDAGFSTLSAELAKRGMAFDEWLKIRTSEIERIAGADMPLTRSNLTRELDDNKSDQQPTPQSEADDDDSI